MRTVFVSDIDTPCVPGPVIPPTGDVGNRPMFVPGTAYAAGFSHRCGAGLSTYGDTPETMSALPFPTSCENPVPDGSAPDTVTVRNGPDWNRRTPASSHPPMA